MSTSGKGAAAAMQSPIRLWGPEQGPRTGARAASRREQSSAPLTHLAHSGSRKTCLGSPGAPSGEVPGWRGEMRNSFRLFGTCPWENPVPEPSGSDGCSSRLLCKAPEVRTWPLEKLLHVSKAKEGVTDWQTAPWLLNACLMLCIKNSRTEAQREQSLGV